MTFLLPTLISVVLAHTPLVGPLRAPPILASLAPVPSLLPLSPRAASESMEDAVKRALKNASRQYLLPSVEIFACMVPSMATGVFFSSIQSFLPPENPVRRSMTDYWRFNGWDEPSFEQWRRHVFGVPKDPDGDPFPINFVVHPWVGFTTQMLYRNHGVGLWQSLALNFFWIVFWKYIAESAMETPHLGDMVGNMAGGLIGEGGYQLKLLLLRQMPPSILRTVLIVLIDPFGTLEALVLDLAEQRLGMAPLVGWVR